MFNKDYEINNRTASDLPEDYDLDLEDYRPEMDDPSHNHLVMFFGRDILRRQRQRKYIND